MKLADRWILIFASGLVLSLFFQNCSNGGFSATGSVDSVQDQASSSEGSLFPTPTPAPTPDSNPSSNPTPSPAPSASLPLPGPLPAGTIFDISTLKDNHAAELSTLDKCPEGSGTSDGCAAMTDYGSMVFDESQERFLMYGGGHGPGTSSSLFTFDFKTQRWGVAYVGTSESNMVASNADSRCFWKDTLAPWVRHTYDMMEIAPNLNGRPTLMMLTSGGAGACTIGHYDITDRRWTWSNTKTDSYYYYASSSAYDPISKQVLILGGGPNASPSQLFTYDPATFTVKAQYFTGEFGYDNNLEYFPLNDKFYLIRRGAPNQVYELTPDRNDFSKSQINPLNLSGSSYNDPSVASGWKFDPDNKVIAGGIANNRFYYIDPIAKTWGSVPITIQVGGTQITATAFHNIAYDKIHKVWVFIDEKTKKTWAFRFEK